MDAPEAPEAGSGHTRALPSPAAVSSPLAPPRPGTPFQRNPQGPERP